MYACIPSFERAFLSECSSCRYAAIMIYKAHQRPRQKSVELSQPSLPVSRRRIALQADACNIA